MGRENERRSYIDLSRFSWTPEKEKGLERTIFEQVRQEHLKQNEILRFDPPRHSREVFSAIAFNVGLTPEDLHAKIDGDVDFRKKYDIAVTTHDWEEAEKIFNHRQVQSQILLDKISEYHHSKSLFKKEPKPGKMFINFHKSRSQKGWRVRLARSAKEHYIARAVNTEEATPLDEI